MGSSVYAVVKEQRNGRAVMEERLFLHVRQADDSVKFFLFRKGVLKSDCIAVLRVKVKEEMIDTNFPKRTWYIMSCTTGSVDPRVNMSFFKLDSSVPASQSPLMQQAYLMAQQEADEKKEKFSLDLSKMTQKDRLVFLSRVLEGPLERVSSYGHSYGQSYFKAVEVKPDRWEWVYWETKEACQKGEAPQGSIPFLAVSVVLPDRSSRNVFYLRYLDKQQQQHDCFFRRVDRDRNIWAEGLFEFIEKLRNYREMCAATGKAAAASTRETETSSAKSKKHKSSSHGRAGKKNAKKSSSESPSPSRVSRSISGRRLLSPRERSPRKTPNARATMLQEVMVTTTQQPFSVEQGDESL